MATNSRVPAATSAPGRKTRGQSLDIRVDTVRKEFSHYPALNDVSLNVRSGELIALLGPSGSGKTTLLRLIAGLELPTAGHIYFGDEDASLKTVQERNVGFVFQAYALFRNMTVLDNISFGLKVRPRATRPIGEREGGPADDWRLTRLVIAKGRNHGGKKHQRDRDPEQPALHRACAYAVALRQATARGAGASVGALADPCAPFPAFSMP